LSPYNTWVRTSNLALSIKFLQLFLFLISGIPLTFGDTNAAPDLAPPSMLFERLLTLIGPVLPPLPQFGQFGASAELPYISFPPPAHPPFDFLLQRSTS